MLEKASVFKKFNLDPDHGFIYNVIKRSKNKLPCNYKYWEDLVEDIVALTTSGQLFALVDSMPFIDVEDIICNEMHCERAYMILSIITHCYVRGRLNDKSKESIPSALSKPYVSVSEVLGLVPIVTFSAVSIFNLRYIDESKVLSLDNMWTQYTMSGCVDESWFYLVSSAVEAKSGKIISLYIEMINCLRDEESPDRDQQMLIFLQRLKEFIDEIALILVRMYESNIPAVFYQRVRRNLGGWKNDPSLPNGLIYGEEKEARFYAGGSAAQSPLIQSLDIALGIRHSKTVDNEDTGVGSAGDYLIEMRKYMTRKHREFLCWLEDNLDLHEHIVEDKDACPFLLDAYNDCLSALRLFRNKHLNMVTAYIVCQANKSGSRALGTGGSNPIPFLKEIRSHLDASIISEHKQSFNTSLDDLSLNDHDKNRK